VIVDDVRRHLGREQCARFDATLATATFVRIQDVADYFWLHEQNEWDLRVDFPCIAAPWPVFWMEWKSPRVAQIEGQRYRLPVVAQVAVLGRMAEAPPALAAHGARWVLALSYLSAQQGSLGEGAYPVGEDGRFVKIPLAMVMPDAAPRDVWVQHIIRKDLWGDGHAPEAVRDSLKIFYAHPVLLALSFCHARNVRLAAAPVPPELRQSRARRGAVPIEQFYTLDIGPLRAVLEAARSEAGGSLRKALHLVRGHFKQYDAEHPLFGKHTGLYWWGLHARGQAEQGTIRKDYAIHGAPASGGGP